MEPSFVQSVGVCQPQVCTQTNIAKDTVECTMIHIAYYLHLKCTQRKCTVPCCSVRKAAASLLNPLRVLALERLPIALSAMPGLHTKLKFCTFTHSVAAS